MLLQAQVFEAYFTVCSQQENWINYENHRGFYHWDQIKPVFIILVILQIDSYDAIKTFLCWHHYWYVIIIKYLDSN